jgi:copper oxidase (laccase) domain-containing protein
MRRNQFRSKTLNQKQHRLRQVHGESIIGPGSEKSKNQSRDLLQDTFALGEAVNCQAASGMATKKEVCISLEACCVG